MGNHTVQHIMSRGFQNDPDVACLERLTIEEIEADILEASRRLRLGIPEQQESTYCYPCYLDYVGEGLTRRSYVPVIARHFIAGRGRGERGYNYPATCDLAYPWSWNVEHLTGPELVGLAEQALGLGNWVIFTMHGIDEGHLPTTAAALLELCQYLDPRRDLLWVAPVVRVAQRVKEWRKAVLSQSGRGDSQRGAGRD